jgi:GNAT superfamily N-acetyltransferase
MMTEFPLAAQPPDPAIHVRAVTLRDIDMLLQRCWPRGQRPAVHRLITRAGRMAEQGFGRGLVAVDEQGPYAYSQMTCWPRCCELSDLIVSEPLRHRGVGTALIQHLVHSALALGRDCVEIGAAVDNPRAAALYHRLGFQDSYTVRLALERGEVEVVYMRLDLPPELARAGGQSASEMLR